MRKFKIAFFAEMLIQDFDGATRTMFQVIKRIPKSEFEFVFFCGVPPENDFDFRVVEVPVVKIPYNKSYKVGFPYFNKNRITEQLDEFQPDVIHFASPSPLAKMAKKYAKKNDIPVVAIYHTHFISYIKYYLRKLPFLIPLFHRISKRLTYEFYNDPDKVYVPTKEIIDDLRNKCLIQNPNLQLWQRGVDAQLFNPAKKDRNFIKDITKNDDPIILFTSRLVWEKNLQQLINLYKLYEAKKIPMNFIVVGDGVARIEIEAQMPNAHFLGMINHEKLSILYASSDVYFFPSDTETFGNVVIEAMASGLPGVAADGGGPKSFIVDGTNGFLCEPNDVFAYFEKIQELLANPTLRQQFIDEGLKTVKGMNWDRLAEIYFHDLKKLSSRKIPSFREVKQLNQKIYGNSFYIT